MVNWSDPKTIQADGAIFVKIMLVMLGTYGWEFLVTLKYDFDVIMGRRKFKYPMAFYFACRYSLIFALIGINIALNTSSQINCQSLYVFNQFMGNTAIATASTLLMLRTIAIWSRNIYIVVPLAILSLGQWAILLHGVITVHAEWVPAAQGCVVTGTLPVFLDLVYVYTMAYDLVVLILSSIGLIRTSGRSDLWALLFKDGIVFFIVAFTANCIATVLLLLNLNPVMNIIATVPAAVASTTVACRGFVRLSTWNSEKVYLPTHVQSLAPGRPAVSMATGRASGATNGTDAPFAKASRLGATKSMGEGVHISMEAYTTTDNRQSPLKEYDDEDTGSESDATAANPGAVRYTRSERAQIRLPNATPTLGFTQDLTRGNTASPVTEKN